MDGVNGGGAEAGSLLRRLLLKLQRNAVVSKHVMSSESIKLTPRNRTTQNKPDGSEQGKGAIDRNISCKSVV